MLQPLFDFRGRNHVRHGIRLLLTIPTIAALVALTLLSTVNFASANTAPCNKKFAAQIRAGVGNKKATFNLKKCLGAIPGGASSDSALTKFDDSPEAVKPPKFSNPAAGDVLMIGGLSSKTTATEFFHPATKKFAKTGITGGPAAFTPIEFAEAGQILIAGGLSMAVPTSGVLSAAEQKLYLQSNALTTAQVYAFATGTLAATTGGLNTGRAFYTATPIAGCGCAADGQVLICDSTTVNLYKLAAAALDARPGRRTIVADAGNFPTDRYVLDGLAAARGLQVTHLDTETDAGWSASDVEAVLSPDVALVCLSHVDYRSAAIADLAGITRVAHEAGALVLWDLCHSVGAVPIDLDGAGVDLAVGCTYKYLDAGPGAPAFLYVARQLQEVLRQPIWGWFGQREQFAMGPSYDPAPTIDRFATGTPNIVGIALVDAALQVLAAAGIERLRAKGAALTSYLVELFDRQLAPLGFELASPRDPASRGAHVSLRHPAAWQLCRALIDEQVIPDYREPDLVRLGFAALTTTFVDVHEAVRRLEALTISGTYLDIETVRSRVT